MLKLNYKFLNLATTYIKVLLKIKNNSLKPNDNMHLYIC